MTSESKEYAKALYSLAQNKNEKSDFLLSLNESLDIFDGDIYKFYIHPEISKEKKKEIILSSFPKGTFRDFILVLIDNDRLNILKEIRDEYENILLNDENIVKVFVYSKEQLKEDYLMSLKEKLSKKLSKEIKLINEIDKSIIGGIKIMYESKIIDLTVNKEFDDLVSKLKE